MKTCKLTKAARSDLKEIGQYTSGKWGVAQEKLYLTQLFNRITDLTENPKIGRDRPEIAHGARSIIEGKHVIFYAITDKHIEILRVLHGQMDVKRKLKRPRR